MEFLQGLLVKLSELSASTYIGIAGVVLESILRLIPSEKPLSIAYFIADGIKMVGQVFSGLGALLDKVLPQRLK